MKATQLYKCFFIFYALLFFNPTFAQITCPTSNPVTVTNAVDGAGNQNLRWAIGCVNNNANLDEIVFQIDAPQITFIDILTSDLPVITSNNVLIDGTNLGTAAGDIALYGGYIPFGDGLEHTGTNSEFRDIELVEFPGHGIYVKSTQNSILTNVNSFDNGTDGIFLSGVAASSSLTNCITEGNSGDGLSTLQVDNITFNNHTSNMNGNYGFNFGQTDNINILSGEASSNAADGVRSNSGGASPISISNFIANNNVNGITLNGRTQVTFNNVTLDGNSTNGLSCNLSGVPQTATYTNVTTTNNGNYGATCTDGEHTFNNFIATDNGQGLEANCGDLTIDGGDISNNLGDGMDLNVDNSTEIKNLSVNLNGMHGVDISNPVGADVLIDNCTFNSNSGRQIWVRFSDGVTVQNSTLINGTTAGVGALELSGDNFLIVNNIIGEPFGGNAGLGIDIHGNGTTGIISSNSIGYNASDGVNERVNSDILITENDFICNSGVGIDREPTAPNVPVITTAYSTLLEGTAPPNTLVEIFLYEPSCTSSVMGYYQLNTTADGSGNWSVPVAFSLGDLVTATATQNGDNTSEFAAFATVVAPACPSSGSVTVKNTNDSGAESLRWALGCANANTNVDIVVFDIPGTGPHIIQPTTVDEVLGSKVYEITDEGITIDGSSDPDGIIIDGAMSSGDHAFSIEADNVKLIDFIIQDFPATGVWASFGFGVSGLELTNLQSNDNGDYGFLISVGDPILTNVTANNNGASSGAASGSGIEISDITGVTGATLDGINVNNNDGRGIHIGGFEGVVNIDNVFANSNTEEGIYFNNLDGGINGDNLTADNNTLNGIHFFSCSTTNLTNISASNNMDNGLFGQWTGFGTNNNFTFDGNVNNGAEIFACSGSLTNGTASNNQNHGIYTRDCNGFAIDNFDIFGNTIDGLRGNVGFFHSSPYSTILKNSNVHGNGNYQVIFGGQASRLEGTNVYDSSNSGFPGVLLNRADCVIDNCVIGDMATPLAGPGIEIDNFNGDGAIIQNSDIIYNPSWGVIRGSYGLITQNVFSCNGGGISGTHHIPSITSATSAAISGTSVGGAVIEVFEHDNNCPTFAKQGHIYKGMTTADASGAWSLSIPSSLGDIITVTATIGGDDTSPFSALATVASSCPTSNPTIVTTTGDSGVGSLRWALECANDDSNLDIIEFNIAPPGSGGDILIQPTTQLPFITDDNVLIDGTSQPTGDRIYIDGSGAAPAIYGLILQGDNITLDHLGLINWGQDGVLSQGQSVINDVEFLNNGGSSGIIGAGIRIPTDGQFTSIDGCLFDGNQYGIRASVSGTTIQNTTIQNNTEDGIFINGNPNPSFLTNLNINNNAKVGVRLDNADGTNIDGCNINNNGTQGIIIDEGGGDVVENSDIFSNGSDGIYILEGFDVTIRGCNIYSNSVDGIKALSTLDITVENNDIGLSGGNMSNGVTLDVAAFKPGASNSAKTVQPIGGIISLNTITNNAIGIRINDNSALVEITENEIYCNATEGIDRTNNTPVEPTITTATTGTISGTTSVSSGVVEIFTNDDLGCTGDPDQGKQFLGNTTASGGNWSFTPVGLSPGDQVTATVTQSGNNTSQFASALVVGMACPTGTTVTVTNNNDFGDGSLRWAIDCANADPVLDNIVFGLPPGTLSIQPILVAAGFNAFELTDDNIFIDGSSQPGIVIDGLLFSDGDVAINIQSADNVTIKDITVEKFLGSGITTSGTTDFLTLDQVILNQNGTHGFYDIGGTTTVKNCVATFNTGSGFYIESPSEFFTIMDSDASSNGDQGITLDGIDEETTIENVTAFNNGGGGILIDNCVDITLDDVTADANYATGIVVKNVSTFVMGTDVSASSNIDGHGIQFDNCIGVDFTNTITDGNDYNGIFVDSSPNAIFTGGTITNNQYNGMSLISSINPVMNNITADINTEYGIRLESCDGSLIDNSSFTSNMGGVFNVDGSQDIIRNSTFFTNCFHGISIENGLDLEIRNCDINSNAGDGINCLNTTDILIENNTIGVTTQNLGNGVTLFAAPSKPGATVNVKSNVLFGGGIVQNNFIQNNTGFGVLVGQSGSTYPSAYIVNNNMQCNAQGGISNPPLTSPSITLANPVNVMGTGTNGTTVHVYTHNPSCANMAPCQGLNLIGTTTVAGGTWTAPVTGITAGMQVTATQTFGGNNTSSFSTCALVMLNCDADTSSTNVTCFGLDNGTATSTGNSMANYTYTWSNDPTNPIGPQSGPSTVTGLTPGTYYVTVLDGAGCIDIDTFIITEPFPLEFYVSVFDESCAGENDGLIDIYSTFGGTPPYTYNWSHGPTTNLVNNLAPGMYTVTVQDANMCQEIETFTIDPGLSLISSTTFMDPLCNGGFGSATVNVNPMIVPPAYPGSITINWYALPNLTTPISTSATAPNLAPGQYQVEVEYEETDFLYCKEIDNITITEPPLLIVALDSKDVTCNGDMDGEATATATGGTPPYTYSWNNGTTDGPQTGPSTITGLSGGTYLITIMDANSCPVISSIVVNEPTALDAGLSVIDILCDGDLGSASASPSGGTPPYEFDWSTGSMNSSITGLTPGSYSLTVTDDNDCQVISTFDITPGLILILSTNSTNVTCNGENDGTATVNVDPTLPSMYVSIEWYEIPPLGTALVSTASTATGLAPGQYEVVVIYDDMEVVLCEERDTVTITEPTVLAGTVATTDEGCFGAADGEATATATGGTPPYTFNWSTGFIGNPIMGLAAGMYDVTIVDDNGCDSIVDFTINGAPPIIDSIVSTNLLCFDDNSGAAQVYVNPFYTSPTIMWSNFASTSQITGLAAGTYTVTVDVVSPVSGAVCSASDDVTLTEPSLLTATINSIDVSCFGGDDGTATAFPDGGTPPFTYFWSPGGQTTQTATGLSAGAYSVTILDANMCEVIETVTINEPPRYIIDITGLDLLCFEDNSGGASVNVLGSPANYTYLWNNGATTQTITSLTAGTYSVTVTDLDFVCQDSMTVDITQPDPLEGRITGQDATCFGIPNGILTSDPIGGTPPYTYSWNPGGFTTQNVNGVGPGAYTLTLTDDNDCVWEESVFVGEPAEFLVEVTGTDLTCFGDGSGAVNTITTNGVPNISYVWSNGSGGSAIGSLAAGTYSVTATDGNGCVAIDETTITEPSELTTTISTTVNSCSNSFDGTATSTANGGTPGYNYNWSNGGTGSTISNLGPNTYLVTITDQNGCEVLDEAIVTAPQPIFSGVTYTDVTCNGYMDGTATGVATGGNGGPFTFIWNPGGSSQFLDSLPAGVITVEILDNNGCSAFDAVTIGEPNPINLTSSSTNVTTIGGNDGTATAGATGDFPPFSYAWSNGSSGSSISGLAPGSYSVSCSDDNGCQIIQTVQVLGINCQLEIDTFQVNNNQCFGDATGEATVTHINGTAPYSYLWSNGNTTSTISNVQAGIYSVTVTDAQNCQDSAMVTITEPLPISPNVASTNVTGLGITDGTATATPTGGTPGYTYLWTPGGQTSSTITGLMPGTYTVEVRDTNNCLATATAVISPFNCSFEADSITVMDVGCNGEATGSVSAFASGGVQPYTYFWSNGGSASTISNVPAGNYTVTVVDATNCGDTLMATVNEPLALMVSTTATNETSNGADDGTATASVSGGTPGYNYLWSNGATTSTITGLSPGTYSVTCSDQNGCSVMSAQVTVEQYVCVFEINSTIITDVLCNGDPSGNANPIVVGGTGSISYAWSDGSTSPTLSGVAAGSYTVIVSDSTNCLDTAIAIINEPMMLGVASTITNLTTNGGMDGTATANPSGGTSPYSYSWSTGETTQTAMNLGEGTYSVTCTDANGCSTILTGIEISPFNCDLEIIRIIPVDADCFGEPSGEAFPEVTGEIGTVSYSWSNNTTNQNLTGVGAGVYTLTIVDDALCTATMNVTISEPSQISSGLSVTNQSAAGLNDGTATASPSGGTPPYQVSWSTGASGNTITDLPSGNYSVDITDVNDCIITESFIIQDFNCDLEIIFLTGNDVSCFGLSDGSATPILAGGNGGHIFNWSNGSTDSLLTNIGGGTYIVSVTDAANCFDSDTIVIVEPLELEANLTFINESSLNANDGFAYVDPMGGTPSYTINWSTGSNADTIRNLAPGSYSVEIEDDNGCSVTESFTIGTFGCTLVADSISFNNVTCFGGNDGEATSFFSGETNPVSFIWSNGETTQSISNLSAGTYFLTINDASNCAAFDTVIISQPTEINISLSGTNETAVGANDGAINSLVTGGIMPYGYLWSNGETTPDISNLAPGVYSLEITDANNCVAVDSIRIFEAGVGPCDLEITLMQIRSVRCFGESNGSVTPTTLGGTAPFNFDWSDNSNDSIAMNLTSGQYYLTITDGLGCMAFDSAFVPQPDTLVVSLTATDQTTLGVNDGTIAGTVTGGNAPYNWLWNNGETMSDINDLAPGVYMVEVTDRNSCIATASIRIRDANDPRCSTFAGSMSMDTISVCAGETVLAIQVDAAILDSNDVVEYVIHESPSDLLGSILATNTIPEFTYNSNIVLNQYYYISAIAGNDDGFGGVDLADSCLSVAIGQPVIFKSGPAGIYSMQGPNLVCGNEPFVLEIGDLFSSHQDIQYRWQLPTGQVIFTEDPEVSIIPNSNLFTGDYIVYRDSAGCSSVPSAPIFVEVVSLAPNVIDAGRDTVLCDGTSFNIEATTTLTEPGSWSSVGFASVVNPTSLSTEVRSLQPGSNYFVWRVVQDECPAAAADSVHIIIESPPVSSDDFEILETFGDEITIDILANDNLIGVVDTQVNLISQPNIGNLEFDEENFEFKFWLNEEQRGAVTFKYEVCNTRAECYIPCDTSTVTIYAFAYPSVAGGITPDGDGNNDVLEMKGLKGFDKVKVRIVNRWGALVYESDDYANDDPWDGSSNNSGTPLPEGAYFYMIEAFVGENRIGEAISGAIHIVVND